MEIKFYGANCIRINNKKQSVVIDDNLADLGSTSIANEKDIALSTGVSGLPKKCHFGIDMPGEYEVSDVSVIGIAARSHLDEVGKTSATMYRILIDGLRIAVVGHIHPDLSEKQQEELGTTDILFVPVGGNGYTLDSIGAQKVIKAIEPKIVIPTHYNQSGLNFEVPQAELSDALKNMAMEPAETVDVLKTKNLEFGDGTKLIVVKSA